MSSLERIKIKGFKSIRELDLQLGQINVLIGANGAGKSNVVSFFEMLDYMVHQSLQFYVNRSGGANSLLHYGAKRTPQLEATLRFRTHAGCGDYYVRLVAGAPDTVFCAEERISYPEEDSSESRHIVLGPPRKETYLNEVADQGDDVAAAIRDFLTRCKAFHFHETSGYSFMRGHSAIRQNRPLEGDGRNLAAFLYALRHWKVDYYRRIVDTIRGAFPQFGGFDFEADRRDTEHAMLNWREARHPEYLFGPHQLPDGLLRFIALVALLLQPEEDLPEIIIIDEPELGLHPYALNVFCSLIRKACVRSQVILATQSAGLVDRFQPQEMIVVERKDSASVFKRLEPQELAEWLGEYTISELWEKNVLGGRPTR